MGCRDECELADKPATLAQLIDAMAKLLPNIPREAIAKHVKNLLDDETLSDIYKDREQVAEDLLRPFGLLASQEARQTLVDVIRERSKCYAMLLGAKRAGRKGYADKFEEPKLFPGRMAEAASWGPPTDRERSAKPWLGAKRLIFISDMGDALSRNIPFEFLKREIIDNVTSANGQRHIWLWLTKQPRRMAEFARWLEDRGITWPENLVAMTTVTSSKTLGRIAQLMTVPSRFRGLSVEPLFGPVTLPLKGIDWVIVGGGSDVLAEPFHVEWALDIRQQCPQARCSFFLKQLGRHAFYGGKPLEFCDKHGGDWTEWREDWRVREIPAEFR